MASNQTFVRVSQESKLNVQRSLPDAKTTEGSRRENQKRAGDFIGLPPLRSVATADTDWPEKRLSPLNKWQIQRCSPSLICSRYCQEERVNEFLHRNHIRVLDRLPRMDPFLLTNRGTDLSKFINFIYPPPFGLKRPEEKGSRERNHFQPAPQEPKTPCPRLLRSSRSEREMFALNPVVRVGGGYRRLSWKVLDVLPAIGQYASDVPTACSCTSCNAILPVTEKVTHSRGRLSTVITIPRSCPGCGADPSEHRARSGKELHQSVTDTLETGDSRFITDHRHFDNSNEIYVPPATRLDWREDLDSYRHHVSRQSQYPSDGDLDTSGQSTEMKSSKADKTVFITEAGADVDKLDKSPDVRRAWDDFNLEVAKDPGIGSGGWRRRDHGNFSADDYENDDFTDFELIEDYDPQSGLTVRLRRRTFGSTKMADYLIHGFHDDQSDSENAEFEERKDTEGEFEGKRVSEKKTKYGKANKHAVNGKGSDRFLLSDVQSDEEQVEKSTVRTKRPKKKATTKRRNGVDRNTFSYTVKLDQRDKRFDEDPMLQDEEVMQPAAKFSDNSMSDGQISLSVADWDPEFPLSGANRSPSPSLSDSKIQEDRLYSSSLSYTSPQHDGYLADSEENTDPRSLEAQIKKVRSDAKRYQTRKEERQAMKRKESIHKEARDDRTSPPRGIEKIAGCSPLTNGEWDSEWESDFSLHVKPLSSLSESSSEERWRSGEHQSPGTNPSADNIARTTNESKTRISMGNIRSLSDLDSSADERARNDGTHTSNAKIRTKQVNRNDNLTPVPPDQPKPHTSPRRPRIRVPRSEDELSESDMKFFTQQLQAPYFRRDKQDELLEEFSVGCQGMNCHRCVAFMAECQDVCSSCGTLCRRSGWPCKACRDVCETCNKPRFRCASAEKRLEKIVGEEKMCIDSEGSELRSAPQLQTATITAQNCTQVPASKDEMLVGERLQTDDSKDPQENYRKNKEWKTRAPPKRKTKDLSKIKRVRGKRRTSLESDDSELKEERELSEEEPEQETTQEQTPLEDSPSRNLSSVFPAKPVRKAKPSKRILSQTVVYKGGDKQPSSETQPDDLPSAKTNEDSEEWFLTSTEETVQSDEEESLSSGAEEPGDTEQSREPGPGNEPIAEQLPHDINSKDKDDVITKPGEIEKTGEEQETKKREKHKAEEKKKKIVPKLRGVMRVNEAFKDRAELSKRLQSVLKEATSGVIGKADMKLRKASDRRKLERLQERAMRAVLQITRDTDSTIDYLAQYRLVDRSRLEMYARAFTLEDENEDGIISYEQMLLALEGVPSITGMSRKQLLFVLQILELGPGSRVTFKLFAVLSALCEKITLLDDFVKRLVEDLDLFDIECKLDLFKQMFFVAGDYSVTYITPDQLRIELKAGGLNQKQEDHVVGHILQSTQKGQISFMDYMAYFPLFLSIHKNICDNALDMSRNKYQRSRKT